jgi:hypothetical protein
MLMLRESLSFDQARIIVNEDKDGKGENLYMEGICLQGGVKNGNGRVYDVKEITRAIDAVAKQIRDGHSILGELDHPDDLKVNLDRVCHMVTNMWMDGPNGYGKLKILPTPMGQLVSTMLKSGVKLGVSSRGSGNVDDSTGKVSDFEMVTIDVVAQPSAPNAYPRAVYESLMNMRYGHRIFDIAREAATDQSVQTHLKKALTGFIKELKI